MSRHPIGDRAMTDAERQARHRAAQAAGMPVIRIRRPIDRRGRAQRRDDTVATLVSLQAEYAAWLETMPEATRDSATGDALQAVVDLDLDDLIAIRPPRGFGRD
jgi:hypothetical protein